MGFLGGRVAIRCKTMSKRCKTYTRCCQMIKKLQKDAKLIQKGAQKVLYKQCLRHVNNRRRETPVRQLPYRQVRSSHGVKILGCLARMVCLASWDDLMMTGKSAGTRGVPCVFGLKMGVVFGKVAKSCKMLQNFAKLAKTLPEQHKNL